MDYCDEGFECLYYILVAFLAVFDLIRLFIHNNYNLRARLRKEEFQILKEEQVLDLFPIVLKIIFIVWILLGSFLMILLQLLFHREIKLPTILIEFCFLIIWIFHIGILIYYSQNYGSTLTNLRVSYFVCFACQAFLAFYLFQDLDFVCRYVAIARAGFVLLFIFVSWGFSSDYTERVVIFKKTLPTTIKRRQLEQGQQPSIDFKPKLVINNEISNIEVILFREHLKREKRTIIYQISYRLNNKERRVYRSYREFVSFYTDLRQFKMQIPSFPEKKSFQISEEEIEERRFLLDEFLQGIMEGLNDNKLFRQFLNVNNDTIQYKTQNVPKTQKRNPEIKVSSQRKVNPYDSIPETIWEGEIEEEDSLEHQKERKKKKKSQFYNNNTHSPEREQFKEQSKVCSYSDLTSKLLQKHFVDNTYQSLESADQNISDIAETYEEYDGQPGTVGKSLTQNSDWQQIKFQDHQQQEVY